MVIVACRLCITICCSSGYVYLSLRAYDQLHLKHETLSLITPQFETPLPSLQPAIFPPSFHELLPPALDLFDLDEHFSSEKVRIAQLTNKCKEILINHSRLCALCYLLFYLIRL